MNARLQFFLSILLCLPILTINAVVPYISIRSPSVDSTRDLVGQTDKVNLWDMENFYLTGAITLEGTRSFDADALTHFLFGATAPSATSPDQLGINISGSRVPNRGANDWLADYFGLPTTYQSTLYFEPRVSNFIIDFSGYFGLDEWVPGLYFRAHAPVVATRWNLNFTEVPVAAPLALMGYDAGYFAPAAVPVADLLTSATDFFSNEDFPILPGGVTFAPLRFARFERTRQTKTALAEIQMALGYNFLLCDDYHLGLNFRVYAPTGNRPQGEFVFEPIVGNGKHWEVGVGYTGHYTFWRSCDDETTLGFYSDGNFTHQCRANQRRTFDLVGKPDSRYMLAEQLGTPVTNLFGNPAPGTVAGSTVPAAQFKNAYTPVANLTTLPVKVSSAIQIDITALVNYSSCGLSLDLGYNLWARTCEHIIIRDDAGPLPLASGNVWALKGDAYTYGFVSPASPTPGLPVALSATESLATINAGTNTPIGTPFNPTQAANPNIDNPQYAVASTVDVTQLILVSPTLGALQQRTSVDPIFLSNANIDINSARTRGLSNKVFAHLNYTWYDCEDVIPYLGIGGKAEFGPRHNQPACISGAACSIALNNATGCSDCNGCQRCNLSEWGIWIKGGIFYN